MNRQDEGPTVASFRFLWAAHALSQLGTQFTVLAVPLTAALLLGATPAQMGLLAAVEGVPFALAGPFAGVLVDRLPRRRLLVGTDLLRAFVIVGIPAAAVVGLLRLELLYVVVLLVGVGSVLFEIAQASYTPALVEPAELADANGRLEATRSAAEVVGPGLAGALIGAIGAPLAVAADAVSFLLSALLISRTRPLAPVPRTPSTALSLKEVTEGFRALWRDGVLRALALAAALFNLADGVVFGALYIIFVTRALALPPALVGIVFAFGAVGGLLGGAVATRVFRRLAIGRGLIIALGTAAIGTFLVPTAGLVPGFAVPFLVVSEFLVRTSATVFRVGSLSLRQARVGSSLQGRVGASHVTMSGLAASVGALSGGVLAESIGIQSALLAGATVAVVAVVVVLGSPVPRLSRISADTSSPV
jgi:predicted MFS family arabinose efflux permease